MSFGSLTTHMVFACLVLSILIFVLLFVGVVELVVEPLMQHKLLDCLCIALLQI